MIDCSSSMLLTHAVQPDASDVISEARFYVATHFLTEIWDRRCWHQKAGIFYLIFSQKMGINILGGLLRKSNPLPIYPIWLYTGLALCIDSFIPNLTVARLQQFRPPQLRIQREQPTNLGLTDKKPSFTRNPHVIISHPRPFTANVVPKLVAMATFLRHRSRLCLHRIA